MLKLNNGTVTVFWNVTPSVLVDGYNTTFQKTVIVMLMAVRYCQGELLSSLNMSYISRY